jgi:hypothetical protein
VFTEQNCGSRGLRVSFEGCRFHAKICIETQKGTQVNWVSMLNREPKGVRVCEERAKRLPTRIMSLHSNWMRLSVLYILQHASLSKSGFSVSPSTAKASGSWSACPSSRSSLCQGRTWHQSAENTERSVSTSLKGVKQLVCRISSTPARSIGRSPFSEMQVCNDKLPDHKLPPSRCQVCIDYLGVVYVYNRCLHGFSLLHANAFDDTGKAVIVTESRRSESA